MPKNLTSTDFYSGVGGWTLGLRMAGIETIASYEHWPEASETNALNNDHTIVQCDIRLLDPSSVPVTEIVVGSPPCTQFSMSNRGGQGDTDDGLKDIASFLRIVQVIKPAFWVMENVPAVAAIVEREISPGGKLEEFHTMDLQTRVFDLASFGLPQRRRRCLIGNINFDLLSDYAAGLPRRSLQDVIGAFQRDPIVDPIYGLKMQKAGVKDQLAEDALNTEEERINRAAKTLHPVYNGMFFPDRLDLPSRTVTATCTRVSRESIIVELPEEPGTYRRLTIRERASAQGFPISFNFCGTSYGQRLKMVGNAMPPLFAYYIGHAIKGTIPAELPHPLAPTNSPRDNCASESIKPDRPSFRFPSTRRFKFAIPSLHMKSGMRFELTNGLAPQVDWHVQFVFGPSKNFRAIRPDATTRDKLLSGMPQKLRALVEHRLWNLAVELEKADFKHMQSVWCHNGPGATRPFMLLDLLEEHAASMIEALAEFPEAHMESLSSMFAPELAPQSLLWRKLRRNDCRIVSGALIAASVNETACTKPGVQRGGRPARRTG